MNPLLLGGIFDIGKKIIGNLFPDPEQKAKAELQLLQMQQDGHFKELEIQMSAIIAEAKSSDPFTSRARPSFMYVFYFVIISLVIIAPLIGVFFPNQMTTFFANVATGFKAIPEPMWWTFSAGYLGYGAYRSFDKAKMNNKP